MMPSTLPLLLNMTAHPRASGLIARLRIRPFSSADVARFAKTLADLLRAGIDLPFALQTVMTLTRNRRLQTVCQAQTQLLLDGKDWVTALLDSTTDTATRWPNDLIAWAGVAIRTGTLVQCLDIVHRDISERSLLRQTLLRKLSYPLGVLMLALALAWFTGSQFQSDPVAVWCLSAGVAAGAGLLLVAGISSFHKNGGLIEQRSWRACLDALALLTGNGIAWPQALEILTGDLQDLWRSSPRVGMALTETHDFISTGMGLHDAALQGGFPESVLHNLKLSEMTGDLSASLSKAARLLEVRQCETRERLLGLLPAGALALAGLALAAQYALFIQPLYQQMGTL